MVAAILGKKIGMTQVYDDAGRGIAATVVEAGPCVVLQTRSDEADGYEAVQLGFGDVKPQRASKAIIGHCARAAAGAKAFIREIRIAGAAEHQVGQTITVEEFERANVKYIDVTAVSKGRGFAGVMKRHNFGGQPDSHGTQRKHRSPGSIGGHASDLGRAGDIKKGKRMAGHMGNARCTVRNQALVEIGRAHV